MLVDVFKSRKRSIIIGVTAVTCIILTFIIGFYSHSCSTPTPPSPSSPSPTSKPQTQDPKKFHEQVIKGMQAENIRENLRYLSKKPHAAGSPRNNEIIKEINSRFTKYGFTSKLHSYHILLSYPKNGTRNYGYVLNGDGSVNFTTAGQEKAIAEDPTESDPSALPPFSAYGPNGTVKADIVYVNFGRYEDFEELENKHNISCKGKIVLVRYGGNYRGDKVYIAHQRGAVGVLVYMDPAKVAPFPEDRLFPNGRWLPRDGVERGSFGKFDGDVLTPGWPAKEHAYRNKIEDAEGLPKIVVQPISATDALGFFKHMGGKPVPAHWKGYMNITYTFGPFKDPSMKAKIEVHNENKIVKVSNVVGTIKGNVEPDRYVLVGNHIDAWVFGATDPSSGTASLLEIARSFGEALKKGWKPRRTIKLCGWDGEEAGIIGSAEWVEEFASELTDRAVAYINLDTAVAGNYTVKAAGSPLLNEFIQDVLKDVPDPHNSSMSVLDMSAKAKPDKLHPGKTRVGGLGAGSDYYAFYQTVGVASIDYGYRQDDLNNKYNTSFYPMYHTLHDTFYWMEKFVDKDFMCHLTMAKITAYSVMRLADARLLPFSGERYVESLTLSAKALQIQLAKINGSDSVKKSMEQLEDVIVLFADVINKTKSIKIDDSDILRQRQFNNEMMQIEKGFIYPYGLPGRPSIKHYLMAPSKYNAYGASNFPAITEYLWDIEKTNNWDAVKKQITITAYMLSSVTEKLISFEEYIRK